MSERQMRRIGFGLTIAVVASAMWVLNFGAVPATTSLAAECPTDGDGGGGSPSPTETDSPSPTESGDVPEAAVAVQTTGSPSPSDTEDDGPLPDLSSLLGESESPSPTQTGSPSPDEEGAECRTKVTIKYKRVSQRTSNPRDHFRGRVKSPNSDCERGRDVLLKKVKKKGKARTVGRTISERNGSWKIRGVRPKGRFYALAKKRDAGDVTCKKGKSKTIKP